MLMDIHVVTLIDRLIDA